MPSGTPTAVQRYQLDFEVRGTGDPILFISGLNDDRKGWAENVPAFEDKYQCILFDNRDAGASPRADRPYTSADMAVDALCVLDRAGIDRAHVIGHSMGGTIAQSLVLQAPERVRSLVLVDSYARLDPYARAAIESWKTGVRKLTPEEFAKSAIYFWLGETAINAVGPEALVEMFAPAIIAQGAEALCRQVDACLAHDTSRRLGEIAAPTLVVWGTEDRLFLEHHALELRDGIAGSRYVRVQGSGHSPTVEQAEALNQAVLEFLSSFQ